MEQKIIFRNKLDELNRLADENGGGLTRGQVEEVLAGMLSEEQMVLVYQYLEQQKIRVEGWSQSTGERLAGRRRLNLSGSESPEEADDRAESQEHEAAASGMAALFESGAEEDAENLFDDDENDTQDSVRSVLEQYLDELGALPEEGSDNEQKLALLRSAAAGDAQALEKAAVNYLPMICDLAGEYEKDAVLPVEDLIQEGNMALWTALMGLGEVTSVAAAEAQLMNAVSTHMEEVLKEEMDETDSDQAMARKVNRLHEAIRSLEEDAGRIVDIEELSAFLEMSVEDIRDVLKLAGDELKMD